MDLILRSWVRSRRSARDTVIEETRLTTSHELPSTLQIYVWGHTEIWGRRIPSGIILWSYGSGIRIQKRCDGRSHGEFAAGFPECVCLAPGHFGYIGFRGTLFWNPTYLWEGVDLKSCTRSQVCGGSPAWRVSFGLVPEMGTAYKEPCC